MCLCRALFWMKAGLTLTSFPRMLRPLILNECVPKSSLFTPRLDISECSKMIMIVIIFNRHYRLHQRDYLFLGPQIKHWVEVGEHIIVRVCVKELFLCGNIFLQHFDWAKIPHLTRGIWMYVGNLESPVLIPLTFFDVDLQWSTSVNNRTNAKILSFLKHSSAPKHNNVKGCLSKPNKVLYSFALNGEFDDDLDQFWLKSQMIQSFSI